MTRIGFSVLLACALAAPVFAGESSKAQIGKKSPAIEMTDTNGDAFVLHECKVQADKAEAAVRKAAAAAGAKADVSLDTKLADLSGMDADGAVLAFIRKVGQPYGLTATASSIEDVETLADVVDWIAAAEDAPLVLFTWSPNCGTTKALNDRIVECIAENGIRAYAVACNYKDTDEDFKAHMTSKDFPIRIFPDREQKVTDVLGGRKTPHFFVFDTNGVLRYSGGLDNDPRGGMEASERDHWLADAADAVREGRTVMIQQTEPAG